MVQTATSFVEMSGKVIVTEQSTTGMVLTATMATEPMKDKGEGNERGKRKDSQKAYGRGGCGQNGGNCNYSNNGGRSK